MRKVVCWLVLAFLAASLFGQDDDDIQFLRRKKRGYISSSPSITLINHTIAASTNANSVTTPAVNMTGATFEVIAVICAQAYCNVPSDSGGNTWTALNTYETTNHEQATIYYAAVTGGASQTFSESAISSTPCIAAAGFSGVSASPFDTQNGSASSGSPSSIQPGSLTPSAVGELLITAAGWYNTTANSGSINDSFGLLDPAPAAVSGTAYTCGLAYLLATSTSAIDPTWTINSTYGAAAAIASFR